MLCKRNIKTYGVLPCKNTFEPKGSGLRTKKFCSIRCKNLYNTIVWKENDPSGYAAAHAKSDKKKYNLIKGSPEKLAAYKASKRAYSGVCTTPEFRTITFHYNYIFKSRSPKAKNYKGMPFFDAWNPSKGGSFKAAYDWIIKNLGKRPENTSMHIIKHELGFVPDNLSWTHPKGQTANQMFRIIANLRFEIKELKTKIEKYESVLYSPGP